MWASGTAGAGFAVAMLAMFAAVHLIGELLHAASGWSLAFAAAPEARQGMYQSFFSAGQSVGESVGPLLIYAVVLVDNGHQAVAGREQRICS